MAAVAAGIAVGVGHIQRQRRGAEPLRGGLQRGRGPSGQQQGVGRRQGSGDGGADPAAGTGDECSPHASQLRARAARLRQQEFTRSRRRWLAAAGLVTGSLAASRSSGASALVSDLQVGLAELAEQRDQGGDPVGQRLAVNGQPARGDVDEHRTQIGRVARTLHQADLLQPADRHGRGGRAHAFVRGQIGHPDRTADRAA